MDEQARPLRAAVIGSGFGGLAAAIRLAAAGVRVTVFEARDLPGGRAYVYKRGRLHVRRRPDGDHRAALHRGAVRARRPADDATTSRCCRSRRSTGCSGPTTAPRSTTTATATTCSRRSARAVPTTPRATCGSSTYSRKVFETGYTKLAHTPFPRFSDMLRVAPQARRAARRSLGLRDGREVRQGRARARGAVVPLAARRRQPVRDVVDLHADPLPRADVGRVLPARRHRRAGRRAGQAARRARRRAAARGAGPARARDRARRRPRHLVTTDAHRRRGVRPRRVERRPPPHLRDALRRRARRRGRWSSGSSKMDWSMSLFVLYFGTDSRYRDQIAHHTVVFGPRYRGLLDDIFHGNALAGRLLALPPRAARHRSVARAAGRRRVLRAVAGPAPRQRAARLGRDRDRLRRPHPRRARARCCPTCAGTSSCAGSSRRADFQSQLVEPPRLGVQRRADADPERVLPPAQQGRPDPRPLHRRRGHPPRRRRARRDQRREGDATARSPRDFGLARADAAGALLGLAAGVVP